MTRDAVLLWVQCDALFAKMAEEPGGAELIDFPGDAHCLTSSLFPAAISLPHSPSPGSSPTTASPSHVLATDAVGLGGTERTMASFVQAVSDSLSVRAVSDSLRAPLIKRAGTPQPRLSSTFPDSAAESKQLQLGEGLKMHLNGNGNANGGGHHSANGGGDAPVAEEPGWSPRREV